MSTHDIKNTIRYPYSFNEYVLRIIWPFIHCTIWKISWHRIYFIRMFLLRLIGAKVNLKSMAFGSTKILRPWDLEIGSYVTLGPRVNIYNLGGVKIGNNSILSQDVYVCGGTHDYTDSKLPLLRKKIIIGSDVWICAGAFIGPGVTVGDGAVIGARAVLLKDAEPWSVYGGNPARKLKPRKILI